MSSTSMAALDAALTIIASENVRSGIPKLLDYCLQMDLQPGVRDQWDSLHALLDSTPQPEDQRDLCLMIARLGEGIG